jgi:energy-coupling factor transporter ATP-binding protein EcfA2
LDSKTGQEVLALFDELHDQGLTLIVVTHDHDVAKRAERIITISDGEIIEDRRTDSRLRRSIVARSDGVHHELSNGAGDHAVPATIEVTASPEPQVSMSGE